MTTDLHASSTNRVMPTPTPRAERHTTRPRLVVLECNPEMRALLSDILAGDFDVSPSPHPASIATIDTQEPDVLLVGTLDGGLTPDEIVALTARHMRLHAVPMVLMSTDANVLHDAGRLTQVPRVTVLSLPFDVDAIRCVLSSVALQAPGRAAVRLPQICAHGFDVGERRCAQCA